MALIEPNLYNIEIEIPNMVIDNTIFKRKAKLHSMVYNMQYKQLVLNWVVTFYSRTDDDAYGEDISYLIPPYTRENIADNSTLVNPATGQILVPNEAGEYEGDYMGQYDWFNQIGESVDINVHTMIKQYGQGITDWNKRK